MSNQGMVEPPGTGGMNPNEDMKAWSWAAFNSTYLPALILAMGTGIPVPAMPAIAKSFHIEFTVAKGITTSFLIGNVAGALPAEWLIDRYGWRRVMLRGPVLTAVMAFAVVLPVPTLNYWHCDSPMAFLPNSGLWGALRVSRMDRHQISGVVR